MFVCHLRPRGRVPHLTSVRPAFRDREYGRANIHSCFTRIADSPRRAYCYGGSVLAVVISHVADIFALAVFHLFSPIDVSILYHTYLPQLFYLY